jgi:hypothetical protein
VPGVHRRDVVQHLGVPNAEFDNCRVLTYRIAENSSGYYIVAQAQNAFRGIREGVPYDAVIEFDEQGNVQRYNLATVKHPPDANAKTKPAVPAFVHAGSTRREEVLLQLGNPDGVGRDLSWFWYGSAYRGGYSAMTSHDRDSLLAKLRAHETPRLRLLNTTMSNLPRREPGSTGIFTGAAEVRPPKIGRSMTSRMAGCREAAAHSMDRRIPPVSGPPVIRYRDRHSNP